MRIRANQVGPPIEKKANTKKKTEVTTTRTEIARKVEDADTSCETLE